MKDEASIGKLYIFISKLSGEAERHHTADFGIILCNPIVTTTQAKWRIIFVPDTTSLIRDDISLSPMAIEDHSKAVFHVQNKVKTIDFPTKDTAESGTLEN